MVINVRAGNTVPVSVQLNPNDRVPYSNYTGDNVGNDVIINLNIANSKYQWS